MLVSGLQIHEELAAQVRNQARELVRQVSINTSQEEFRKKCARMPGMQEKEACQLFEQAFQGVEGLEGGQRVGAPQLAAGSHLVSFAHRSAAI